MVPRTPVSVMLRPLAAPDATAARALADAVLGGFLFAEAMLASLDEALRFASDEYRAIAAHDGKALTGLVVFGEIAGTHGTGRVHLVAVDETVRRRGIGTALMEAACADLHGRGSRFVVIELVEEPRLASGRALAHRTGFREEGRVHDYARDGLGLSLLRRDPTDAQD
jgi:ribosomal protein S18 acetylase RimI-like enzyme